MATKKYRCCFRGMFSARPKIEWFGSVVVKRSTVAGARLDVSDDKKQETKKGRSWKSRKSAYNHGRQDAHST